MVLRRPYAFLIKHFRLIHIIITAIFTYVAIMSMDIYKYLNSVVSNTLNRYNSMLYIKYSIFLFIFLALLLCTIVFFLLKYKNKPRKIYILTFVGYLVISIFIFTLFNYMRTFSDSIIDSKTIRLYRDVLLILHLFEFYIIIFMLLRGLGFDIKKFNFSTDIQELKATLEDSEEIEIDTRIDTTNVVRNIRKQGRELGYYYKEFKIYIIIVLVALSVFLIYKGYNFFTSKLKIYNENDPIGEIFNITIKDSYYYVDDTDNYVIINFDINKHGIRKILNSGLINLTIGRKKYTPDKNICSKFSSLGICYKRQYINENTENYIFAYKVDKLNIQRAYIEYNESYDKQYKVKLIMKEFKND